MKPKEDVLLATEFPAYEDKEAFWKRLKQTAAQIRARANTSVNGRDRAYHATYPAFIRYFRERPEPSEQDLLLAVAFTYGWMPRILQIVPSEAPAALRALRAARAGEAPSAAIVSSMAQYLAGSISGASKVLHFAAPELYPIWDSRVAYFLRARAKKKHQEAKVAQYLAYTYLCAELGREARASALCAQVGRAFEAELSPLRALELVMYLGGIEDASNAR